MNADEILCTVYRSSKERDLYLYVNRLEGLEKVPRELLDRLGTTSEVLTLKLHPARKLARARAPEVLEAIRSRGYFLQLPPDKQVVRYTQGE